MERELIVEVNRLLALPRERWEKIDKAALEPFTLQEITGQLDAVAQRAVQLSEYLDWHMDGFGCGTHSHGDAVKAANRKLIRVRNAMGFTYPKHGIFPF